MGILEHATTIARNSATIKEKKRKRERQRGQAGHRFLFETDLCTKNLLPVFRVEIHYIFCFFDSSPPPPLPSPRCEGRAKKKEKEKKKKTRRTHSPHLTLHQCGIYMKPNPPLPGGSSLYIQQQHHISIPLVIIVERDRLVDFI